MAQKPSQTDDMPTEVDFAGGERGKFYQSGARFHLPVYLDESVLAVLTAAAQRKGVDVSDIANEILRRDIESAQALL
ncbi:MAG: hypothetical protein LBG78_08920 [Azoarcus sp.]|nr:hypothetical protein [Azoarcus sp.]